MSSSINGNYPNDAASSSMNRYRITGQSYEDRTYEKQVEFYLDRSDVKNAITSACAIVDREKRTRKLEEVYRYCIRDSNFIRAAEAAEAMEGSSSNEELRCMCKRSQAFAGITLVRVKQGLIRCDEEAIEEIKTKVAKGTYARVLAWEKLSQTMALQRQFNAVIHVLHLMHEEMFPGEEMSYVRHCIVVLDALLKESDSFTKVTDVFVKVMDVIRGISLTSCAHQHTRVVQKIFMKAAYRLSVDELDELKSLIIEKMSGEKERLLYAKLFEMAIFTVYTEKKALQIKTDLALLYSALNNDQ